MSSKARLDKQIVARGLLASRSQAESYIKAGQVKVNGQIQNEAGFLVNDKDEIELATQEQYVSRAGLKLASVSKKLGLDFKNKVVLDVGSSTGGFTDYSLKQGAERIIAVELGTNQLHPILRGDKRIELHEKTDIRNFKMSFTPDIIVIDVSFISLKEILPAIIKMASKNTQIVAMVKPQFEADASQMNKGVIKNSKIRREILKDFENWSRQLFVIIDKADSDVAGAKGNLERFYLLKISN